MGKARIQPQPSLPLQKQLFNPQPQPPSTRRASEKTPWRPSILLVDGRGGIRDAVCNLLRAQGFACDSAEHADSALCRLKGPAIPDIIIAEHSLPELDALQFVSALRHTGFDGKIFVHATHLDSEEARLCATLGVDRLFVSPGALADLLQELEKSSEPPRADILTGARLARATRLNADSPALSPVRATL